MPALTIKNIPEPLYLALKEQARKNHRSINGEAIACFERAMELAPRDQERFLEEIRAIRAQLNVPRLNEQRLREAKDWGRR